MKPCKHLDYDTEKYGSACALITEAEDERLRGFSCPVKYWRRLLAPPSAITDVQFCGLGRGRINRVFACYNPGEMPCHEE